VSGSPHKLACGPGPRCAAAQTRLALATALLGVIGTLLPASANVPDRSAGRPTGSTIAARQNAETWDNRGENNATAVDERARGETQPEGIRFGNYIILSTGEVRTVYSDNIYGTATDRIGDFSVELIPRIRARSQFGRHALNFDFGGRLVEFANEKDNNHVDGFATMDGELHINHAHTLTFGLTTDYVHESRLARIAPREAAEKTPIWHTGAHLGLTRDAGRLAASIGATYDRWDFADVTARDGGKIDQDFRDTTIYASDLQLKYRFSPGYAFETKLRGLRTLKPHSGPPGSDSWGYDVTAGIRGEFSPLFHWSIAGGYGFRDFDEASLTDTDGWLFEANAKYLPRQWLQFTAFARQSFVPTEAATDVLIREFGGETKIEARHDLILTFGGSHQQSERDDDYGGSERWNALARLEYRQSKHLHWTLQYDYSLRSSTEDDWTAEENKIWLGAKFLY
jgi:hypothetical protein